MPGWKGSVAMGFVCPDTTPGRLPAIMPGCPDTCKCESFKTTVTRSYTNPYFQNPAFRAKFDFAKYGFKDVDFHPGTEGLVGTDRSQKMMQIAPTDAPKS